jgi:hypothetical protein
MSAKLSVEDVLANLEQRAGFHREQEAFHAQQEVHHREQRAVHAAELATVEKSLEAFRNAAATAVDLARPADGGPVPAPAESAPAEELPPPNRNQVGRLIWRIVASPGLAEPFGPSAVAAELNRRYGPRLRKTISTRTASNVLRRLLAEGHIRQARQGKPVHEALYTRKPG